MKNILYTIILSFLFSFSVFGDWDAGWDAYIAGDYETAFREIKPYAEQGNTQAQHMLGVMYDLELGVTQDYQKAVKWYRLAAEQGYAEAQFNLAHMYKEEKGVPRDYKEAMKWYRLAAEQAHATAQYMIGLMYKEGNGVPRDYKEAMKWYRLSAKQGYSWAQHNLASMLDDDGFTQDYQKAVKWYRLAAEQGLEKSQHNLGLLYLRGQGVIKDTVLAYMWLNIAAASGDAVLIKNRDSVESVMTSEQLLEAQNLTRECIKKNYKNCGY